VRRRRVAPGLVAVALLFMLGACSGGDGGSSKSVGGTAFADATCADLAQWAGAVQPMFTDLQAATNLNIADTAAAKAQLAKLSAELQTAEAATTKLSDGINSRPAPDIDNGDQVKTTLVTTLNQLRDIGTTTRTQIDQFDVANATADTGAQLRQTLSALNEEVAGSLAALQPLLSENEQLRNALNDSATCQQAGSQFQSSS
jgi:hypothetical protein